MTVLFISVYIDVTWFWVKVVGYKLGKEEKESKKKRVWFDGALSLCIRVAFVISLFSYSMADSIDSIQTERRCITFGSFWRRVARVSIHSQTFETGKQTRTHSIRQWPHQDFFFRSYFHRRPILSAWMSACVCIYFDVNFPPSRRMVTNNKRS